MFLMGALQSDGLMRTPWLGRVHRAGYRASIIATVLTPPVTGNLFCVNLAMWGLMSAPHLVQKACPWLLDERASTLVQSGERR